MNFNMCSKTIIVIPKHFQNAMIFKNDFFMVKSTVVQPLLARLATVLVWQRAVNRQPGSRARTRRAGAPEPLIRHMGDTRERERTFCLYQPVTPAWNHDGNER